MSNTSRKHKAEASTKLNYGIFTCSTSRYHQMRRGEKVEDVTGDLIETALRKAGHKVALRKLIPDNRALIRKSVNQILASSILDAAVFCGGTGVTRTDLTIETVSPFLEKALPGFGEIFRRLSFDEIGSAAILSRAVAGVSKGKVLFCLPGSPEAAKLCVEKLILPEASHIVKHARE